MPGTVAAFHTIGQRHAVLPYPYGMTYLRGGFIRYGYRAYRSGWAYFAAFRTLRSAVTTLITHFRLHQPRQISGRAKHLVGAGRHTELAGSTMLCEMPCAQCSRRDNRVLRSGIFLSSMTARPPSTFFSCAFNAAVVATKAVAVRKERRASLICSVEILAPFAFDCTAFFIGCL